MIDIVHLLKLIENIDCAKLLIIYFDPFLSNLFTSPFSLEPPHIRVSAGEGRRLFPPPTGRSLLPPSLSLCPVTPPPVTNGRCWVTPVLGLNGEVLFLAVGRDREWFLFVVATICFLFVCCLRREGFYYWWISLFGSVLCAHSIELLGVLSSSFLEAVLCFGGSGGSADEYLVCGFW